MTCLAGWHECERLCGGHVPDGWRGPCEACRYEDKTKNRKEVHR